MMPLNIDQLKQLDQRAKSGQFSDEDYQLLRTLLASHRELVSLLKDPDTSLDDVYKHLPGYSNETAADAAASDSLKLLSQDPDE